MRLAIELEVFAILACTIAHGYAGVRSGNGRIVGGTEAKLHEFPWQVLLIGRTYHGGGTELCGASLLNEKWVVTAAHCFWTERYYEKYELRFGKHDLRRFEPSEESRFVRKVDVICHPYYNPANLDNDVALMLLSDPLDFHKNPYVRPINLPDAGEHFVGAECIATGWGATRFGGPLSDVLLKVHLPVWSNNDCRKVYSDLDVTDNMFCAGYSRGGKDTCHGDSGGPFICPGLRAPWVLAGITSWGEGCGAPNHLAVFTRVTSVMGWIQDTMKHYWYKYVGADQQPFGRRPKIVTNGTASG